MIHKIIYAVNSNDDSVLQIFIDRLLLVGIQTKQLRTSDKCVCLESLWDDTDILKVHKKHNSGAKLKRLQYEGNPVTCGIVYMLRNEKNLSDAEIGLLLDVSESTIARRRKKHIENGCFYEGSATIF